MPTRRGGEYGQGVRRLICGIGLAVVGVLGAGCLNSACFVKDCDDSGQNCSCSMSNCGEGAQFDTSTNRCRCLQGFLLVQGQCMKASEANGYCGAGQRWENDGCVPDNCPPGEEVDHATGHCMSRLALNELAAKQLGVQVGTGQKLGCPEGQKLVVDGQNAVCVPLAQTCARDESWDGKACVKLNACPAGAAYDEKQKQCVQFAKANGTDEMKVELGKWSASHFGPDNGDGTPAFCNAFSRKPYLFSVNPGATAAIKVQLAMAFEGAEISKGVLTTQAAFDPIGGVPQKGMAEIEASAKAIFATLQKGGGRSDAASFVTTVRCSIVNSSKPKPVPSTGGL